MGRWSRRKTILAVATLVIVAAAVAVLVALRATAAAREGRSEEMRFAVKQPYRVLAAYADDIGHLPADPLGSGKALYKLKPYLDRVHLYDWPRKPTADVTIFELPDGSSGDPVACWDDGAHSLLGEDIDYVNEPRVIDRRSPRFAVYAAVRRWGSGGRWVVFCNGAALWISDANRHYDSPLGLSWQDLEQGEAAGVGQPISRLSKTQLTMQGWQCDDLVDALVVYATKHGATPASPDGGDHALYQLKGVVPDAGIFDAVYGRLENGAAFYDQTQHCVVNGDFVYLNEPLPLSAGHPGQLGSDVCTLCSKPGVVGLDILWVIGAEAMEDGQVRARDLGGASPLGEPIRALNARPILYP